MSHITGLKEQVVKKMSTEDGITDKKAVKTAQNLTYTQVA